jgi:hypothetical protein
MKPNKICPALVVLALSLIVLLGIPSVTADEAAPQLPQGFYGMVEAGTSPVGPGLIVEAVGPGVSSKMEGNPVTTLADGSYGALNFTSQKLIVQGDIATGTSITFYVGAIQAEVYDVAAGGGWNTTYSFQPGEITELNLRIASMPAAGQTREPTPVQTIVASSTVAASSTIAASSTSAGPSTTASGGSVLPQVPDSSGLQPTAEVTQQSSGGSAGTAQPVITGQESTAQGASQQSGGQESQATTPVTLPASGNMTLYIVGGILMLLVIGGGAYYYTQQKKSDTESKEETGKKEE